MLLNAASAAKVRRLWAKWVSRRGSRSAATGNAARGSHRGGQPPPATRDTAAKRRYPRQPPTLSTFQRSSVNPPITNKTSTTMPNFSGAQQERGRHDASAATLILIVSMKAGRLLSAFIETKTSGVAVDSTLAAGTCCSDGIAIEIVHWCYDRMRQPTRP